VMSVDSSNWMAKSLASLLLAITCDLTSSDMFYIRRLLVLSDVGIFRISFSYSSPNIMFTILQHYWYNFWLSSLCDFIFFCNDFGNNIACFLSFVRNSDCGPSFSLACLISCKPLR
jgi:hypothetical protein